MNFGNEIKNKDFEQKKLVDESIISQILEQNKIKGFCTLALEKDKNHISVKIVDQKLFFRLKNKKLEDIFFLVLQKIGLKNFTLNPQNIFELNILNQKQLQTCLEKIFLALQYIDIYFDADEKEIFDLQNQIYFSLKNNTN